MNAITSAIVVWDSATSAGSNTDASTLTKRIKMTRRSPMRHVMIAENGGQMKAEMRNPQNGTDDARLAMTQCCVMLASANAKRVTNTRCAHNVQITMSALQISIDMKQLSCGGSLPYRRQTGWNR